MAMGLPALRDLLPEDKEEGMKLFGRYLIWVARRVAGYWVDRETNRAISRALARFIEEITGESTTQEIYEAIREEDETT
jgi:hypothetical protein